MLRKLPTQRPAAAFKRSERTAPPPASPLANDPVPKAVGTGTMISVVLCALTAVFMQGVLPSDVGRFAAIGVAISLVITVWFDFRAGGLKNLIRADLLGLAAFYFLTFFEFLFPQPNFDEMISVDSARMACVATIVGFIGLLIGRHLWQPRERPFRRLQTTVIPANILVLMFWACFVIGYLHMIVAVDFKVKQMITEMMLPRFSQSWTRGRLGDWKALLGELGMFIYLIPPLAGIMLARRERYSQFTLFTMCLGLGFTYFYGFTSGTRNVFASYLVTMMIGYAFALPQQRQKEILVVAGICVVLMGIATPLMLAFRTVGFKTYFSESYIPPPQRDEEVTLFVDYNIYAIGKIMETFPEKKDYLGLEIPFTALIRPIPRAVWPGKPEGLSYSIEDALGVQGLTISATFVGEAYMGGGYLAVLITGLGLGALAGWWCHLVSIHNSELGILIYASGFFAAVICMRSLFVLTTAMLPTIAAIAGGTMLVSQIMKMEDRLAARRALKERQMQRLNEMKTTRR